jgi:acetyl esterase/lipase
MTTTRTFDSATYTTAGSTRLGIDIFPPTTENRRCAVLVLHGGAWRAGAKEAVHDRAGSLAAAGVTALAVQYRLLDAAPWPAPLADVSAALAWTRANAAELHVDPEWTVAQGHSAGAHIALMAGTLEPATRPAAIVAYYPPIVRPGTEHVRGHRAATTSFLHRVVTHRADSDAKARAYPFPPTRRPPPDSPRGPKIVAGIDHL